MGALSGKIEVVYDHAVLKIQKRLSAIFVIQKQFSPSILISYLKENGSLSP